MRAVVVTEYGGPEVLRQVDIDEPHAGVGRVRIRVRAATVNPADVLLRIGDIDGALRASTDRHVEPITVSDGSLDAGLSGPARNVAALYAAFARDLVDGTTVAPSFRDAVRLHGLVQRIASGASTAGSE